MPSQLRNVHAAAMPVTLVGWLFFDYRKGGGLRHNGDFVSPDYVEKAAIELAGVSDACCYGVPAASGAPGESDIVLALVLRPGAALDHEAIFRHLEERLEPNCVPLWVQIVGELPKTISEKPQTRLLAEAFDPRHACRHEDVGRARRAVHGA